MRGNSGGIEVWMYGGIALVVLERSSGTQLVFLKRLDLQPSAEDDNKKGLKMKVKIFNFPLKIFIFVICSNSSNRSPSGLRPPCLGFAPRSESFAIEPSVQVCSISSLSGRR